MPKLSSKNKNEKLESYNKLIENYYLNIFCHAFFNNNVYTHIDKNSLFKYGK